MFALMFVAILCYVVGGTGLALLFLGPEGYYRPSNPDFGVYLLAAGLLFHAISNVLDHLGEINESLKKIAEKE